MENGQLSSKLKALAPIGRRRMSANPHANGGLLRKDLNYRTFATTPSKSSTPARCCTRTRALSGVSLRDVMRNNMTTFRVFGPDETASNRLQAIYEVSKKTWMADSLPEDADGGELAADGRVMEILSEHTLMGWLEGYLLSGRHGFFHTYEAFAHVVDSMFNQHAKWLDICKNHVPWRASVASQNILLSSTVWRQDHNGFSHQDPGFIDNVTNKSPSVTRVYLPPDANTLLAVADQCLRSTDCINVIVADKQKHLQFMTIEQAARALREGHRHLGSCQQRPWRRARRGHGVLRRCRHPGGVGGYRHSARALARSQSAVRERRRSIQDAAGRVSIPMARPSGSSRVCSRPTSPSSSTFMATLG